jgi:rsbT co-antagonist protein RsbR
MRSAVEVFEPIAMAIVSGASLALIREQRRMVVRQQEAMLELSTPVLQFRERLLLLPIVGLIDSQRAQQLTEQLLRAIRDQRALVVVVDITGVVAVDSAVANHLMHTVEAARLMGATVIVTGVSAEVAQTLVTLGIELGKLNTVGDLQGGIDAADRIAGYVLVRDRSTLAAASSSGD